MLNRLLSAILDHRDPMGNATERERRLIAREAKIGATVFGPIPEGHEREFFCLDEHTWIWHESWNEAGSLHEVTTRYSVRPGSGVFRQQNNQPYQPVSDSEARNLYKAILLYQRRVNEDYRQILAS